MMGQHCIKHGSNLQSTIALSSGESEFYALVRASAIGLSIKALMQDWGAERALEIYSDSSAARGTASRRGLGKLRHVQTRYLWIQERVAENHLRICPIGTKNNLADLCTKLRETHEEHVSGVSSRESRWSKEVRINKGVAKLAPALKEGC